MSNPKIAELIAARLKDGLTHPGDGDRPVALPLAIFRTTGMPKETADLQNATAKTVGEAIVHLIESEGAGVIIGKAELEELRRRAMAGDKVEHQTISVHCHCDTTRTNPLQLLKLRGDPVVVLDGRQLIRGLQRRAIECPHENREK